MGKRQEIKIDFSDFWHPDSADDKENNPLYKLLSKRCDLILLENPDFLIYSCFGKKFLTYNCVKIFYTGENVRPNFNECDYAFSFDYPVTDKNYRLPLYKLYPDFDLLTGKKNVDIIFKKKIKFCCFIYSNEIPQERIRFFNLLSRYKRVDSGGRVMNNIGYIVNENIEFMNDYKFTITFESSSYPGYTTEKIMQAMVANSIPIYWGNILVFNDFNTQSFINSHDYNNFDEVIERVIELDTNDDLFKQYLAEPFFKDNFENIYVDEENIFARFDIIFKRDSL